MMRASLGRDGRHDLSWWIAALVLAASGAWVATNQGRLAGLGILFVVGLGLVRWLRLTLVELVVLTSPFMFFPPFARLLNMAASDVVFPILAVSTLHAYLSTDSGTLVERRDVKRALVWATSLFTVLVTVTTWAAVRDEGFLLDLAVVDLLKLLVVLAYLVALIAGVQRLDRAAALRLMRLWVWLAAAQSIGSLAGLVPSDGFRSLGFFQDPNLYAGYLLVSLTIAFVLVAEKALVFWPVWMLLILGGILSTGSRGGILSTLIVMGVALAGIALTRIGVVITVGLVTLTGGLLLTPWQTWVAGLPGAERLLVSSQSESDPRFHLWARAYELWSAHPVEGIGIGQFTRFSAGLTPFKGGFEGQVAHNTFLSFAAESGLLGLSVFLLGCVALARRVLCTDVLTWSTRWSLLLGLVAIGSTMLTINLQNLRYVWIYAALAWVLSSAGSPLARPSAAPERRDTTPVAGRSSVRRFTVSSS